MNIEEHREFCLTGIMSSLRLWVADVMNLLSPNCCAICGSHLCPSEQKLCARCLLSLDYLPEGDFYDNPSARLFWGKVAVERVHSYLLYRSSSAVSTLLMQLKYNHRPDLGLWLGRQMAHELQPRGFFEGIDGIVPVPLAWQRLLKRGYNQSLMLARGVSEVTGLPVVADMVRRKRNNPSQTRLSGEERIQNAQDLFVACKKERHHHVLLVDDVLTTSATLVSCAQAISMANAGMRFSILTLGRAH